MEPDPLIGRIVSSRFQIAAFVREGGMASIYCGVQDDEPRHVALKIMNAKLAEDPTFVRRFKREAEAAARVRCPNAVDILGFGQDEELVYIAMELLVGYDLLVPLTRDGRLSEQRSANIIRQVCEALTVAHAQKVIHRDLKPENVMLVRDPTDPTTELVKVLDFGIAKILDEQENPDDFAPKSADGVTSVRSALTRVGMIVGTPAYMSPEQGRAEPVDARTDIYSCGVLLYELLTGSPPFAGETPLQVVMRHVNDTPTPPSIYIPIHPSLGERQQTAEELSRELEQVIPELSTMPRVRASASAPNSNVVVPADADAATDDSDAHTALRASLSRNALQISNDPTLASADPNAIRPAGTLGPESFPPDSDSDDDDARTVRADVDTVKKGGVPATPPVRLTKGELGELTSTLQSPVSERAPNGASSEAASAPASSEAASAPGLPVPNPQLQTVRMKPQGVKAPLASVTPIPPSTAPASQSREGSGVFSQLLAALQDTDDDKTKRLLVAVIAIGSAVVVLLLILVVAMFSLLFRDPEPPPLPSTPNVPAQPQDGY